MEEDGGGVKVQAQVQQQQQQQQEEQRQNQNPNPRRRLDPETEFLWSKEETSNEWELLKENVRPLKRGRNVSLLNIALKSQTDLQLKKLLLDKRRKMIEEIDDYKGEDPLHPYLRCIKWVQESFPHGGDYSGLVVIYEQCVRAFWHDDRYKDDLRYLKVWLEYAENCVDAEVIYNFLDANKIGQTHSVYYISYALLMEKRNKIKTANDIFNRGLARNAQPRDKLEAAFRKFVSRTMTRPKTNDEDSTENRLPVRSFGTLLARGENRSHTENSDLGRKKLKSNGVHATPLAIFKDKNANSTLDHQPVLSKTATNLWHSLGTQTQRNKENNAVPSKWTTHKIPQKPVPRTGGATASACIEVFVDEECAELHKSGGIEGKSSTLQLREGDGQDLKNEMELLRENPLRNFPVNSLPR